MPIWTPESSVDLNSDPVTAFTVESATMKLWHEFLSAYFNGVSHSGILFPKAEFLYQQMEIQQLEGVAISVLLLDPGKTRRLRRNGARHNYNKVCWLFQVRAEVTTKRADGHNSRSLARMTADILHGLLLMDSMTFPLNKKGISHIQPAPHSLVSDNTFAMRQMKCHAWVMFPS